MYGSAWAWALKGGAHRTAAGLVAAGSIGPAVVAMPSDGLWGDGSAYSAHDDRRFDRWIADDVLRAVRENVPAAADGAAACLGGLSMGGYGALRLGALYADRFRAVSGHSSITRLAEMAQFVEEPLAAYRADTAYPDVIDAIRSCGDRLPRLRFDCGTEDPLIGGNRRLHAELTAAGIRHDYAEYPGGHSWAYWAEHVSATLRFFDRAVRAADG